MQLLIDILKLFIQSLAELIGLVFDLFKKDHSLKANFGSKRILSKKHKAYAVGHLRLSEANSDKSKIIVGPTGTGKSTIFYMNTLFSSDGNFAVLDGSGELLETCGASLVERGYTISVINGNNADASTDGWNPLEALKTSSENSKSFATILINNAMKQTSDVFWNLSSINTITFFIDYMFEALDPEEHNLYTLKNLLQDFAGNQEAFDEKFADPNVVSEATYRSYKAFVASDTKITTGVLANCQAALGVFDNQDVARVTSTHTFSMEHFIQNEKQAVFVQNSVLSQDFLRPVNSLFFYFFFETIMRQLRPKDAPMCFFLIDEASSIRLGNMLPLCLVNLRKYRSSICLGIQSFQQLETLHSREQAVNILQNCHVKVFLRNLDINFSKMISDMLGAYTYKDDKSETDRNRMLMTPDMIRSMGEDECLLFVGGKRGMLLRKLKPFYKIKRHLELSKLPMPSLAKVPLLMPKYNQTQSNEN